MDGLQDKVALVTGSGSGIGRATALRFAQEGTSVVVADIVEDGGNETVEMIEQEGGEAIFVQTDVTNTQDVEAMVREACETYGELNFAHNNAGIEGNTGPLAEVAEDDWDQVLGVNLKGVWQCMKHEIPEMIENGGAISLILRPSRDSQERALVRTSLASTALWD